MSDLSIDNPFWDYEGKEQCLESLALARLLIDDIVFANEREYIWEGKVRGSTTLLYVVCNDIFAWGCADAQDLPNNEIPNLYKMHMADKEWGSAKWCCIQRQQQPQPPVVSGMKKSGSWDEAMEALPSNTLDAQITRAFTKQDASHVQA